MKIGYVRYSEFSQSIDEQTTILREAGCIQIYSDAENSGTDKSWPGLGAALRSLRPGDEFVVSSLDRLARSLSQLIGVVHILQSKRVTLISLAEQIHSNETNDQFMHHIQAISSFHRRVLKERTRGGSAEARRRGSRIGRNVKLTSEQIEWARDRRAAGKSLMSIARELNVSDQTIRRRLRERAKQESKHKFAP